MELIEKTLSRQEIFSGRIIHVHRDTVELPNGQEAAREVVDHPGGVCVLALDDQGRALLVRQFRYPYGKVLREVPAGKLEYGEDPDDAIVRELREETGASAASIRPLGELYPSPGYCGEIIRMYLAQGWPLGTRTRTRTNFWTWSGSPSRTWQSRCSPGRSGTPRPSPWY